MFPEYNDYTYYIRQCAHYSLSPQEQAEAFYAYRNEGDLDARQRFVAAQLGWVAVSLFKHYGKSGCLMDLIQDATLQLYSLVDSYEVGRAKFRTYAEPIILKQAETNRSHYMHTTSISTNALKLSKRLRDMRDGLLADNVDYDEAIVRTTAYFVERERSGNFDALSDADRENAINCVNSLIDLSNTDVSLDAPLGEGDDETFTLLSGIADDSVNPENEYIHEETMRMLRAAIAELSERERYVIVRYFGLGGHVKMSAVEIADSLGVSRQRVNTIINGALQKLKNRLVD